MGRIGAALTPIAVLAAAALLLSGSARDDPRTPPPLPGLPPPFLGSAVVGNGGLTASIDAYGNVVDLRFPGPAGQAQIDNPYERQAAGSVAPDTGLTVAAGTVRARPLWRASAVFQAYEPGTNLLRTSARVGGARLSIADGVSLHRPELLRLLTLRGGADERLRLRLGLNVDGAAPRCASRPSPDWKRSGTLSWRGRGELRVALVCDAGGNRATPVAPAGAGLRSSARADRRWLARARPLDAGAPLWARALYARSLLVLRALTDRHSGAMAAGLRDGWAYVWPRDAAAGAIALEAAGYRAQARRVVRFLERLDLDAAARFNGDGSPVDDGRELPGDALGWVKAAALATGLAPPPGRPVWRGRGDYGERAGDSGDYLANAIASGVSATQIRRLFRSPAGLVRRAGDPGSGFDAAAAWAVRPFPRPALFPLLRTDLSRVARRAGRFGLIPAEDWPGAFPWTAPTAWTAWSLAALGQRRDALRLLAALRRDANRAGLLPERVSDATGVADSTTPLAWSHAFALLALRELYAAH